MCVRQMRPPGRGDFWILKIAQAWCFRRPGKARRGIVSLAGFCGGVEGRRSQARRVIQRHLSRQNTTEENVKRLPLADYRVVYFATHGLVAGDVEGLGEPSLALTLPKDPSETDDGLLTASEVAQLKLNADWVVLSACNTAAGEKPGAEALSGLARAFFYAGARALLVLHWRIDSKAATRLGYVDVRHHEI
jgi:CHAT domain-containing protein